MRDIHKERFDRVDRVLFREHAKCAQVVEEVQAREHVAFLVEVSSEHLGARLEVFEQ